MIRLLQLFFFLVLFAFGADGSLAGFGGFKGSYKGTVVISGYSVTPGSTTATVNWTNTPAATGRVCYGLTSALGTCTTRDVSPVTTDSASLSGLSASTTYYYQIDATATGAGGGSYNQGFSLVQTFSTTPASGCAFGTAFADGCPAAVTAGNLYFAPAIMPTATASGNVSFGSTVTIPISTTCPSAATYENADVTDVTNGGAYVGTTVGTSGACVSNTSLTLVAVNASIITSSDTLRITNPTVPAPQPTAAQFMAYAKTSGQSWISNHPQPWNVTCLDYACGPNVTVASMSDVAGWTQGTSNCAYMPATDGYPGSAAGWTGTAHISSPNFSTLVLDTTTSGTLTAGMSIIVPQTSIGNGSIILSGTNTGPGSTFQLNKTEGSFASTSMKATNTYFGGGTSFQFFQGAPALVCTGSSTSPFTINGWNFGPTAWQGSPVGSHDCINLIFLPSSAVNYASQVTITNNAFIAGATCNLETSVYGQVTNTTNSIISKIKLWNNFAWGRGLDPCCSAQINYPYALTKLQGNLDVEYNWTYQTTDGFLSPGFQAGNEAAQGACKGGATLVGSVNYWPGYSFIENFNYVDTFGTSYNGAHEEWGGFGVASSSSQSICPSIQDFNLSVMVPPMPNEAETTFFGWGTPNTGIMEYSEQNNNTAISNTVTGKSYTEPNDYYQYLTDGCPTVSALCPSGTGQNHVIVTSYGATCGGGCTAPVSGQGVGGNIGLVVEAAVTPVGFGTWTAGCNQSFSPLCSGEQPALNPNIQYPGGNTSETASGTHLSGTTTSIGIVSACPTSSKYIGAILSDGSNQVGVVLSCAASVLTLAAVNAVTVTSGDALVLWTAAQNQTFQNVIVSRVLSDFGHGSSVYVTAATTGSTTTSSPTIHLSACPTASGTVTNTVVNDAGTFIGVVFTCVSGTVTLYANAATAVGNGDTLSFASFAWGSLQRYQNYMDNSGAQNGNTYDTNVTTVVNGGFQAGAGGGATGGGGCAVPMDYGHGTGNINVLMTTGAEALPSLLQGGC